MTRARFPARRASELLTLRHNGVDFDIGFSLKEDGAVGEFFISCAKVGSAVQSLANTAAVWASIALQHGASMDELVASANQDHRSMPENVAGVAAYLVKCAAERSDAAQAAEDAQGSPS